MSLPYGPNTRLVLGFLSLLNSLSSEQRVKVFMADPSRLPRCSARYAAWKAAYDELQEALRRASRMTATGAAWVAVWDVVPKSEVAQTARHCADLMVGFDLITQEQRLALWEPFAGVAPLPGAQEAA